MLRIPQVRALNKMLLVSGFAGWTSGSDPPHLFVLPYPRTADNDLTGLQSLSDIALLA
jgi:hypothetical protein